MESSINETGDKLTLIVPIDKYGKPSKSGRSMIHYMTETGKWDTLAATLGGGTLNAKVTIARFEPRKPRQTAAEQEHEPA